MQYTGILCGNFSSAGRCLTPTTVDAAWRYKVKTPEERALGHRYYYPKFYDMCFGDRDRGIEGIERYEMTINKEVELTLCQRTHKFTVDRLELYICPFNVVLYSIMVSMSSQSHNDITLVMSKLRNFTGVDYANGTLKPFIEVAIKPIMRLCDSVQLSGRDAQMKGAYDAMLLYGNKFKLFQVVALDDEKTKSMDSDMLIYEFGTLTRIDNHDMSAPEAPSEEYLEKIVKTNRISVFNDWKALALFDTFTMMGQRLSEGTIRNWVDNYFGMIYLYGIFVKVYLFDLNNNYDSSLKNCFAMRKSMMSEMYDMFEGKHYFPDISYNFLPRMVNTQIQEALEIAPEKSRIYERIERQNMLREKRVDSRMNNLLFFISSLTMFSAIWDAACLVNEMYPFSKYLETPEMGFRSVFSIFVLLALLCLALVIRRRR
ncbi:MAG: hypothetical protein J6Q33_03440 [Alistipes sp.]|nr:hypothetical protein [Alistipes sp.]